MSERSERRCDQDRMANEAAGTGGECSLKLCHCEGGGGASCMQDCTMLCVKEAEKASLGSGTVRGVEKHPTWEHGAVTRTDD
jgi:hypothetical protein